MQSNASFWRRPGIIVKILGGLGLALVLSSLCFVAIASAHTTAPASSDMTLQLNTNFETTRVGYWVPVHVTVGNNGNTSFQGTIVVRTFSGSFRLTDPGMASDQRFEAPVTLAGQTERQITFSIPFDVSFFIPRGIVAELLDSHGKTILTQTQPIYARGAGDVSVGILSDQYASLGALKSVSLPDQASSVLTTQFDADTLPTNSTVLENFDVIILDDFSTSTLQPAQLAALQTWVNRGGVLIEVGGPNWQQTLGTLPPALLPVTVTDIDVAPAGTPLFSTDTMPAQLTNQRTAQQTDILPEETMISVASAGSSGDTGPGSSISSQVVSAYGTTPLIVQAHEGQGIVCYLAFDPALYPLSTWPGTSQMWQHLLLHTLGDQLLIPPVATRSSSGPGALLTRGGILAILQPNIWTATWFIVGLLISYVVLLGPVRFLIIKRRRRPFWNWRVAISSILIFSLLAYGIAFYQKGRALTDNSISIVQINQSGTEAHITTYMGVFVPNQGNFQVQFPNSDLPQAVQTPLEDTASLLTTGSASTPIFYGLRQTSVDLLNSGQWTFHPLVAEQDHQLHGTISTRLTLQGNRIVGVITNTLHTSLSDVYILIPHYFVAIGSIAAGATLQISQALQNSATDPGTSLADQIATSKGLPADYYPYSKGAQPQTEKGRHIALLSALNGAGFSFTPCNGSCTTHAITNASKQTIITPNSGMAAVPLSSDADPLLVSGAPATLIGWADQPLDGMNTVTINGVTPHGFHENFIQMPLNIDLSSPMNTPPDFITGQMVGAQSIGDGGVSTILPGVYSMSTASISFEFDLPDMLNAAASGLTITVPNTLNTTASPPGVSYVQAFLYNWQTTNWDPFSLDYGVLITRNTGAYISPDGRVLLQLSNQNALQGQIFLGRPSLSLQG
jgi:hypothetical protein